jgi:hypothetical protein
MGRPALLPSPSFRSAPPSRGRLSRPLGLIGRPTLDIWRARGLELEGAGVLTVVLTGPLYKSLGQEAGGKVPRLELAERRSFIGTSLLGNGAAGAEVAA